MASYGLFSSLISQLRLCCFGRSILRQYKSFIAWRKKSTIDVKTPRSVFKIYEKILAHVFSFCWISYYSSRHLHSLLRWVQFSLLLSLILFQSGRWVLLYMDMRYVSSKIIKFWYQFSWNSSTKYVWLQIAFFTAFVLLFGNEMLLTSFYLSSIITLWVSFFVYWSFICKC